MFSLCFLLYTIGYGQLDQFEISFPYYENSTLVSQDDLGYIWFPNADRTDFFRYNGQGLNALGLATLTEESKTYIAEQALFKDSNIILHTVDQIDLFDLETHAIAYSWILPVGHIIDYVYQDDNDDIWVFSTSKKDKTRPVFKSRDGKEYDLMFDLAMHFGEQQLGWWSMLSDVNGLLYFHGQYGNLLILNEQGIPQQLDPVNPQDFQEKYDCSVFRLDNKNVLWRLYKREVSFFDPNQGKFITHPLSNHITAEVDCPEFYKQGIEINFFWTDIKGRIWLGGGNSILYAYNPVTDELTSFGKILVDELGGRAGDVHSLIEDSQGNIYGAKRGGVFKISEKESYFKNYLTNTKNINHPIYDTNDYPLLELVMQQLGDENITNAEILQIVEDDVGNIYTMDYRFIFKLNPETDHIEILPFFEPRGKFALHRMDQQMVVSIWSSFYSFNDQNKIKRYAHSPQKLEHILTLKNGQVWFSGYESIDSKTGEKTCLFAQADPLTLEYEGNYVDPASIINFDNLHVDAMDEDQNGNLWLSSSGGILEILTAGDGTVINKGLRFSFGEKIVSLTSKEGLFIQSLSDNRLGIFTRLEIGILNTTTNELEQYSTKEELGIDRITTAHFDQQGAVWIGSSRTLNYYEFTSQSLIHFTSTEGFEDVGLPITIEPLKNDQLAVGTENGLYLFDPEDLIETYKENTVKNKSASLKFNSFSYLQEHSDSIHLRQYFNTSIDPIELKYNDKILSFEFTLLDLKNPDQHQYSYWLEGYDQQWSNPLNSPEIKFTSLPTGTYKLKVRAHNGNGIWSDKTLAIPLIIHPAWYKSWWFLLTGFLTFLILSFMLLRHYLFLEKTKLDIKVKQAEAIRMKELENAKTLFYTNITHEFRTPLTVIMGINENSKAQDQEKSLIRRNSKNLLHLINQLLDLSKLESNKLNLTNTQGDIVAYLKYLTVSFNSMASDKNIQLKFHSNIDELTMNYDEVRIQQIIYNLLSNALKFTPEKGKVTIHLDQEIKSDINHLSIRIKDTGCGIPPEDIPHLFDRFYQVGNDITEVGQGTGIGLSLIRELLEIMEGEIEVKSTVGKSTEFIVLLPINNEESADLVPSSFDTDDFKLNPMLLQADKGAKHLKGNTQQTLSENLYIDQAKPILLLIEDNPDVVTYICGILEESYEIVICINGELGIQKAIEIIPDIIISDVMMPVKDGYAVCRELKQDSNTDHIPIILLTAKSTIEDKLEGLTYGADVYLNKPFNKEELMIRLEQLLLVRKKIQQRYAQEIHQSAISVAQPQDDFINTLNQTIHTHLSDVNFGVPELALALLMSQTQVYRKTKALLDKTPLVLIRSLRLAKAQELLKNKSLTISEIATRIGFASPNYFSRAFQNEFGSSPSDYRIKHSELLHS